VYQDVEKDIGYKNERREILRFFVGLGFVTLLAAAAAAMIWNACFLERITPPRTCGFLTMGAALA
jgi:hypothetical protein